MPTRVLVLSGQRTVQQLKQHTDYDVAFAEEQMTIEQLMLADYPLDVDFDDWTGVADQVARLHKTQPLDAVVTGVERLVPLAGMLREQLGLTTGVSEAAARACIDKAATHRLLAQAGVPVAAHRVVNYADEGVEAAEDIGLPVVVKPRDASSAAGLMYCDSAEAVRSAVDGILAMGRDSALVEEFLTGPELGVFASRSAGRTKVVWVVEGEVGPPPTFVKVGGRFPSQLPADRLAELQELTDRALSAVGLDNWVASLQFMLTEDGWKAGEINPRVSGGQAVEMIAATTGYEPSILAVDAALGRESGPAAAQAACGLYRSVVFDTAGTIAYDEQALTDLGGLESTYPPFVELDVKPGEAVLPVDHPRGGAFGRIVLAGDSHEQLERDYRTLLERLDIRLVSEPVADAAVDRAHTSCC